MGYLFFLRSVGIPLRCLVQIMSHNVRHSQIDLNLKENKFLFSNIFFYTDPVWNLTTVEEGYTYVASEGAAKLPRISSTR